MSTALGAEDISGVGKALYNVLEVAVPPGVLKIKEELLDAGAAGALMTGSGTAVFGIFADTASFRRAEEAVKKMAQVYPCHTLARDASLDYEEICL